VENQAVSEQKHGRREVRGPYLQNKQARMQLDLSICSGKDLLYHETVLTTVLLLGADSATAGCTRKEKSRGKAHGRKGR